VLSAAAGVVPAAVTSPIGHERGRLGTPLEVQLREDRADVVLDRLVREEDFGGDLLVGLALGDEDQDLLLLRGEDRQFVARLPARHSPDPLEHAFRDGRVKERLTSPHRFERRHEVARANLFQEIAGGACHDCREDGLVVGERGEHDHSGLRQLSPDLATGLDTRAVRQPDVHHHDVGLVKSSLGDRFFDGPRFGDDLEPRPAIEQCDEPLSNDLMVVDDEQAKRSGGRGFGHRHVTLRCLPGRAIRR